MMQSIQPVLLAGMITSLALAAAPRAMADGLISQLPEDGSWSEFDLSLTLQQDGQTREHSAHLRLSSVGKGEQEGKPCRWIELKIIHHDPPSPDEVTKILVPEESLRAGQDSVASIVRGWQKQGDEEVTALDTERPRLRIGPLSLLLPGPLSELKKHEKENLTVEGLGALVCAKESDKLSLPLSSRGEVPADVSLWRHSNAPFGAVKLRVHAIDKSSDREREGVFEAKLVRSGTDAQSALPDRR